ncbi:MAG: DUF2269 family protein [Gaiellaceae bacterium]
MTWYTFFKSVHVVTAVVWVGGATMIQAYAIRILATGDGKRQAEFAKDTEVVGMRVFIPSSLILVLAAIGMMVNLHWSWSQNWIILGLIAFALSFGVGAGFLGPEGGRIAKLIEQHGPDAPVVKARIRRILTISRCELVVLLTVIVNMVVKPTGQNGWFWGLLAVMVLGIVAVLVLHSRREQRVPAAATQ